MRITPLILVVLSLATSAIAQALPAPPAAAAPDVYPSRRAAVLAIVERVEAQLALLDGIKPASSSVFVTCESDATGGDDFRLAQDVAVALRRSWPKAEVFGKTAPTREPSPGTPVVHISLSRDDSVGQIAVQTNGGPSTVARFVDKSWADDWTAFINSDSNHRWLRGDSPRTAVTQEEAESKARADAANKLAALVKTQMNINAAGKTTFKVSDSIVLANIKSALNSGTAVADTFVQRYQRPYGDVWAASVLIDGSPGKIDTIARKVAEQARVNYKVSLDTRRLEGAQARQTWFSLVAFMGIIVMLYWFLNAATRGYFTWRLRFGAVTLLLIGIILAAFVGVFTTRLAVSENARSTQISR